MATQTTRIAAETRQRLTVVVAVIRWNRGKQSGSIRFLLHKMMKSDDGCIEKVSGGKYVATTNIANIANANDHKQPEPRKQASSRDTTRVSGTVSDTPNANAPTNAQMPLEFSAEGTSVSAVSDVSSVLIGTTNVGTRQCPECGRSDTLKVYCDEDDSTRVDYICDACGALAVWAIGA